MTRTLAGDRLKTIAAVYLSGLLQGIALILFPAAGPLLTDPAYHGLSSGQFGLLFAPQIVAAIVASALAARLADRFGMQRVLRAGLAADLLAMLLLAGSHAAISRRDTAFVALLLATGAIGAGFGFTLSALNAYAFDLFRDRADAAVTALHVMTGLGQVGASLILNAFIGFGAWWGGPLAVAVALAAMSAFQAGQPLPSRRGRASTSEFAGHRLPGRVWLYAAVVFLYGMAEATFGNWSAIYLEQDAGLAMAEAGLALSAFWGAVTAGRALFALIAVRFRPQPLYRVSPFVVAAAFVLLPSANGLGPSMLALGLAGLALSFFFPLSVSLASAEQPDKAPAVSGALVAAIMLGSGLSANAIGFVREAVGLPTIFRASSVYALVMAAIVVYLGVSKRRHG